MLATKSNSAYQGVDGIVKKVSHELPSTLGRKEILIKITHSGICASDLLAINVNSILGHEGVGIVQAVGSDVSQFKVGDRAGGGFLRNTCGHCKYCLGGHEMWCYERDVFFESDNSRHLGTFAEYYVGMETYLHRIPEGLSSEHAAPLQCAGATVYSALIDTVRPGQRVGVVGIGGLGHLAIQFAAKMGTDVIVFSSTADKEKDSKELGACEFYFSQEPGKVTKPVDVLIIAGTAYPEWEKFLNNTVLARQGIIVALSASSSMSLPGLPMLFEGYTVKTSLVATRKVHDDMLEFAAHHSVKPIIETFEFTETGVNAALDKLRAGTMRYRGVLVAA